MEFATPWVLLLLLLLPPLALLVWRRDGVPTLRVASTGAFAQGGTSLRLRLRRLPVFLRFVALAVLIVALARPRTGTERVLDLSEGIAIQMVIDRSGSMSEQMSFHGQSANRLEVCKKVFRDFVLGGGGLPGRPGDLIGLITYARYTDTISPLTIDHRMLPEFLKQIQLPQVRSEDGTAIGDAVALAAARLHTAEVEMQNRRRRGQSDDTAIRGKVIILLTDGIDNASRTPIARAAQLCREWGIKVYTIGIGSAEAQAYIDTPLGRMPLPGGQMQIDVPRLKYLAEQTGGRFYLAGDEEALKKIYTEIDALEKSRIESVRYVDYAENFMPLALCALALLGLEVFLRCTLLRTLP